MMKLEDYLAELRSLAPELPIEPELKPQRQQLDRKIREEQDLAAGAVLSAVLAEGPSNDGDFPKEGDVVYIQYSIRTDDDELLYSTRSDEGGPGEAFAFLVEKGVRVPRSWEIAIKGMLPGQRNLLKVKPSYGFRHPDCQMKPPLEDLPTEQVLCFDIELVSAFPASYYHHYGAGDALYKRVVKEGTSWESPRPPCEVTIALTCCCPAYNGLPMTGRRLYSAPPCKPLTVVLGQGQLPKGVEEGLSYMSKGEVAMYVMPRHMLLPPDRQQQQGGGSSSASVVPPPPERSQQVEVQIELLDMVQVRDMTGTGEVLKKRVREGSGDFPIDCPLNDTTVRVHYKARRAAHAQRQQQQQQQPADGDAGAGGDDDDDEDEDTWAYDSRRAGDGSAEGGRQDADAPPLEVDTGCGELPEGLEMVIKLMVPGEVSRATAAPRYAYAERADCPPGISGAQDAVEFEVELFGFDREGHWNNLTFEERYELSERLKSKGNALFKRQQYKYAKARYERLLRMLESTRDYETDEQVARLNAYKVAVLGNMVLCCMQLEEHAEAVAACDKALEYEPESSKLFFRRGKALSLKGDYEEAELCLRRALELDGSTEPDVSAELAANAKRQKAASTKQRKEFKNFFDR